MLHPDVVASYWVGPTRVLLVMPRLSSTASTVSENTYSHRLASRSKPEARSVLCWCHAAVAKPLGAVVGLGVASRMRDDIVTRKV